MGPKSRHWLRVRPLLVKNAFLRRLPEEALDALLRKGQVRRFAKGEILYRRGDPGDCMMVLITGRAKLTNVSANAREIVLHFLAEGDIFGEISALDGNERAAHAVALEDLEAFVVHASDLRPTLLNYPRAMFEIIGALCEKIRLGAAMIEDNTLAMRGRMARGLLRLARQHGHADGNGVSLKLTISQEELGKHLALSRANVSRQLARLKTAGVIKTSGAQITILRANELAAIGETIATPS